MFINFHHKNSYITNLRWRQNWCQMKFGMSHFAIKSHTNKEKPRQSRGFLWLRRQDSKLRPPGYELLKSVFYGAAQRLLALFQGKPGDRCPLQTALSTLCCPRMGHGMGQKPCI